MIQLSQIFMTLLLTNSIWEVPVSTLVSALISLLLSLGWRSDIGHGGIRSTGIWLSNRWVLRNVFVTCVGKAGLWTVCSAELMGVSGCRVKHINLPSRWAWHYRCDVKVVSRRVYWLGQRALRRLLNHLDLSFINGLRSILDIWGFGLVLILKAREMCLFLLIWLLLSWLLYHLLLRWWRLSIVHSFIEWVTVVSLVWVDVLDWLLVLLLLLHSLTLSIINLG